MRKHCKKTYKGFRETNGKLCKKAQETLAHICECEETEERIERKLTDELKQWKSRSEGLKLEQNKYYPDQETRACVVKICG